MMLMSQQQQQQQQCASPTSLMMIAHQFFQQQQQMPPEGICWDRAGYLEEVCPVGGAGLAMVSSSSTHSWAEDEEPCKEDPLDKMLLDAAGYLDLSPPRTPPQRMIGQQQEDDAAAGLLLDSCDDGGDIWMDTFMSELVGSGGCELSMCEPLPAPVEPSASPQSSDALGCHPCTPDDIWREHFGLNLQQRSEQQQWTAAAAAADLSLRSPGEQAVMRLLLACLDDIECKRSASAASNLAKLRSMANASGEPMERVAAHFGDALEAKLRSAGKGEGESQGNAEKGEGNDGGVVAEDEGDNDDDDAAAYKALDEAVPYLKFAHLTANQALLEATQGARRVHIVDFGCTTRGVQWAALLQAFSAFGAAGRSLRITGIPGPELGGRPAAAMLATARRLSEFAALLGVDFEFRPVLQSIDDVQDEELERLVADGQPGEAVAVNLVTQLAQLSPEGLRRALSLVHRLNPRIVTVAEFEANGGSTAAERLLCNARFYAAVFESLDAAGLARDDAARLVAERRFLGGDIRSSLMLDESPERSEHWKRCVDSAGLWAAGLSNYATSQARLLLWLYKSGDQFTLTHGPGGCLSLGWRGRSIVTVSAWHC